jgi:hypothetical protein
MNLRLWARGTVALVATAILIIGCGKPEDKGGQVKRTDKDGTPVAEKKETKHDEWWCKEHGIPEEECSMCNSKVAKACKARGDWCEKHPDRAKSQCFICDASLYEKYAAKYRAKYGKEPPPPEDNMPSTLEKKDAKKGPESKEEK